MSLLRTTAVDAPSERFVEHPPRSGSERRGLSSPHAPPGVEAGCGGTQALSAAAARTAALMRLRAPPGDNIPPCDRNVSRDIKEPSTRDN